MVRWIEARRRQEYERFERARLANYELANLIAVATHRPRKLPRYRRLDETGSSVPPRAATEADHNVIRAYFMSLARKGARRGG